MTNTNTYRNQALYKQLVRLFGKVLVAREGADDEEYRVCCPFCGDKYNRLYINCKWGVHDDLTGTSNIHLVHCYNEDCVQPNTNEDRTWQIRCENRQTLFDTVYRGLSHRVILNPVTVVKKPTNEPADWPGKVIRFNRLATKYPQHPAVTYMQQRGFDPNVLGTQYGFVYCDQVINPALRMAENTIIMPIWKGNMLYSWICRRIGDDFPVGKGKSKIKKYYNMPGRSLTTVGYNLDYALCHSTLVLVEGILDVIKTGGYATCLFTKTVSANLKNQIIRGLKQYGDDATLIIMLDPTQAPNEQRRQSLHHIEAAAAEFADHIPNILKIYLPDGKDPGSMEHDEITKIIVQSAEAQNIKINLNPVQKYDLRTIAKRMAEITTARSRLIKNDAHAAAEQTGRRTADYRNLARR
jgi:hypothetical protein